MYYMFNVNGNIREYRPPDDTHTKKTTPVNFFDIKFPAIPNMEKLGTTGSSSLEVPTLDGGASPSKIKSNYNFMRKIPKDAEASNILIGEMSELDKSFSAFIRLSDASFLGDLTEVPLPTRFLFILLGPQVITIRRSLQSGVNFRNTKRRHLNPK